jgi:ATP-binding cassette subfamily B protein
MKLFCPEVVQTSGMDCGPAVLKALLEGFGVSASYGRLREACQTDVDGTSIDTLEEIAQRLGLVAEQVIVPLDHLLAKEAHALPAVVVTQRPNGFTHFVLAWSRRAGLVQVMDPATGRRWMSPTSFMREVYVHETTIEAEAWREWAGTDEFLVVLRATLTSLGVDHAAMVEAALADPTWRGLATLDAAARMVVALTRSGALGRGGEAQAVLARTIEHARRDAGAIPHAYWSAREGTPEDGVERVVLRGAVLIKVSGVRPASERDDTALSPDLKAALTEQPARPARMLFDLLRTEGLFTPGVLAAALVVAGFGTLAEVVIFRGLFEGGRYLGVFHQRVAAMGGLVVFLVGLALLERGQLKAVVGLGRRLEARLRIAFLSKIPRIGDRYFASRATSDMAERGHQVHGLRTLPVLAHQLASTAMQLLMTTVGLVWLDPRHAPVAIVAALLGVLLPLIMQPPLAERDLRTRVHAGSLAVFYLDAFLGLVAIRAHGAERAVRREHEGLLVDWARAMRDLLRASLLVEALQALLGFGLSAWLLMSYLGRGSAADIGGALLMVFWALNLPVIGEMLAQQTRELPTARNLALRLLEPLGAPEDPDDREAGLVAMGNDGGVAIELHEVQVVAGGHTILDQVSVSIAPGSHVAVVGPSGAGKSSLVGLLLGWHRAHGGTLTVDGQPLPGPALGALRRTTAWIDPSVQLWNRPFIDNLEYGSDAPGRSLDAIIDAADLRRVLEVLPEGLQTSLGEGGALLSGGEGQRVRFGRAALRRDARLVILDEPFRGLDRERRRALYARARAWWPRATVLCVTHDVGEVLDFPRVLVVDGGRLVEDGVPAELITRESRYHELLEAERSVRREIWDADTWRRLQFADGRVQEPGA